MFPSPRTMHTTKGEVSNLVLSQGEALARCDANLDRMLLVKMKRGELIQNIVYEVKYREDLVTDGHKRMRGQVQTNSGFWLILTSG